MITLACLMIAVAMPKAPPKEISAKLGFIENRGQWDRRACFQAHLNGGNLWLTKEGAFYDYFEADNTDFTAPVRRRTVLKLSFVGGSPLAPIGRESKPGKVNYFRSQPEQSFSGVKRFVTAEHTDVWPGTSVRWLIDQGSPRFDLQLEPGADPTRIQFRLEGAEAMRVYPDRIELRGRFGRMSLGALNAFQVAGTTVQSVRCRFVEKGNGVFGIQPDRYNKDLPLVIDPTLFATYFGGSGYDFVRRIEPDSDGSLLICGSSRSSDFLGTPGSFDETNNSAFNDRTAATVARLLPDGSDLAFLTFVESTRASSSAEAVKVARNGAIVVGGRVNGPGFPVTLDATRKRFLGTDLDGTLFILQSDGSELLSSTLLGPPTGCTKEDSVICLAVAQGYYTDSIVVGGTTLSTDMYPNGFDSSFDGDNQGFLMRYSVDWSSPTPTMFLSRWTYFGGDRNTALLDIAYVNGYIVACGATSSTNLAGFYGSYRWKTASLGSHTDAWFAKFWEYDLWLSSGFYLGGNDDDRFEALTYSPRNDTLYAGGLSASTNLSFPFASQVYKSTKSAAFESFLAAIPLNDANPIRYTFLGGHPVKPEPGTTYSVVASVGVDPVGLVYALIDGWAYKTTGSNSQATESTRMGTIAAVDPDLSEVTYNPIYQMSTPGYYHNTNLNWLAVDRYGSVTVTGVTDKEFFTATEGAFQTNHSGAPACPFLIQYSFTGLKAIRLEPASVPGGFDSKGTIILTGPAPFGGATVRLKANTALLELPATVTIPAGETRAEFTIHTAPTAENVRALIEVSYLGAALTKRLTVEAPRLLSLVPVPTSVTGGVNSRLWVTLSGPAPPGGFLVLMSEVADPLSVANLASTYAIVDAGAISASVILKTSPVSQDAYADLLAVAGTQSKTARVDIAPMRFSTVTLSPASIKGGTTAKVKLTITLMAPAGASGVPVTLASSNPSVLNFSNVTVPSGSKTISVSLSPGAVTTSTQVTITASIPTDTDSATVLVTK